MSINSGDTRCVAAVFVLLLLSACAQDPVRVNTEILTCCEADFFRYETYRVSMTDVPGFLEPYLHGSLSTALEKKGLSETMSRPDLAVNIIFDQIYLEAETVDQDLFGESVDPEISTRFMAAVSVDLIDTVSEHIVWSGRLSRIHNQPFGQPRGNDHKMQGLIDAFDALFAAYPVRLDDPDESF